MTYSLTKREYQVWRFYCDFIRREGYGPSYQEVASDSGLKSRSAIHRAIGELEERGYIARMPNRPRAVKILVWPKDNVCPSCGEAMVENWRHVGDVAAGLVEEAEKRRTNQERDVS